MSGIIWLASYPKSGNTWLRAVLANYEANQAVPVQINELPRFSFTDSRARPYVALSGRPESALTPNEIHALRARVHADFARTAARPVLVKTHNIIASLDDVPLITPDLTRGAIYVIRNPLDVAVSFADHFGLSLDAAIVSIGNERNAAPPTPGKIFDFLSSWSTHVRSWVDMTAFPKCVLRYEDMAADAVRTFGQAIEFLGWPLEPARLERAIGFSSFSEMRRQEAAGGFIERSGKAERFFRQGRVGAWRETLSAAQAKSIIERHRDVMARHGYLTAAGAVVD